MTTRTTCTRRIQFCMGHRVFGHETKCRHLHGHNYVAFITASAEQLDDVGRVIDFGVLKSEVGAWIDETWDHATVLLDRDELADVLEAAGQRVVRLPLNPTAENLAALLLQKSAELLEPHGVTVTKVVLWETENCFAEVVT